MSESSGAKRVARSVAASVFTTMGLAALALFVLTGSFGGAGRAVVVAVVYLVPVVALQAAIDRPLRKWLATVGFAAGWAIFVGVMLAVAAAAAGLGSALTLLTGLATPAELYLSNRMVLVMVVLVSCAIRIFETTKSRLEERNRQLADKVEAGQRALELHQQDFERAREIQQALMPARLPQTRHCLLAAGYQAAREVGGDYYDAIRLGDGAAAIVIADVSGKGMAAALLMSNLQAIVRAFAPGGLVPEALCAKANQLIAGNVAPGKYITFFCATIDMARMRLDYCNAGHNPPLVRRRDGAIEWLREGGPVLGIFPNAAYSGASVGLRAGDCLVCYTDGITEAMNAADEEFGEQRLIELLREPAPGPEQLRQRIMSAVTAFSGGNFHDDATMLILCVD